MGVTIFRPGQRLIIPEQGVQLWSPGVASAAFTGVLDGISNVAAAYSLRKLRSAYSGSSARVRRSSDSTEQDIGFASDGEFDSGAFSSFVGGGTGYVKTWYDQSGNGRDVAMTTTGDQPTLASNAVGGRHALLATNSPSATISLKGTWSLSADNRTFIAAVSPTTTSQQNAMLFDSASGNRVTLIISSDPGRWGIYTESPEYTNYAISAFSATAQIASFVLDSTNGASIRVNGSALTLSTTTIQQEQIGSPSLFNRYSGSAPYRGYCAEFIILNGVISSTNHNTIGSNMATRYGLSWTTVT